MEAEGEKVIKLKTKIRFRKRWTEREIATILNYLIETGDVEIPTAQVYYKKFIARTQLKVPWELVRWKVRHLKNSYQKAEKWLQSIGSQTMTRDNVYKLKRMCPNYDKLNKIFGAFNEANNTCDSETPFENNSSYPPIFTIKTIDEPEERSDISQNSTINIQSAYSINDLPVNSPEQSTDSTKVTSSTRKFKKSTLTSSVIAALSRNQQVANTNERLRLKWEKERFNKEFEFDKEKFHTETQLRREEIELKRRQIEKEEKMKMFELECNERVAKYELDLKYRNQQRV